MTWKRFTRRDTCPVCNGERHDCRQNLETNLIHCRSLEANPLDYIYRGQDTWGFNLWAYKPDAEEWTNERRQEWQLEQQRKRALKEQQEREKLKKLLPIKERDKVIRAILEQLTLSDAHRQRLKARGLTDSQIDEAGYRSVKQWQKLSHPVTNKLSGVKFDGNSLINHTDGILIPIPNEDGLYTHLRVNDLTPDTTHKYYPLSSAKRGVKYHLASGEQPVAVYLPDFGDKGDKGTRGNVDKKSSISSHSSFSSLSSHSPLSPPSPHTSPDPHKTPSKPPEKQIIGFTEGLEYKPLLASSNVGIPIIGASGGNFASSRGAIETGIATIKEKLGMDDPLFVLYADAGSAINPNVTRNYQKLGEFIPNLKIADWGQLTNKKALDIDEIDVSETQINFISVDKFSEKARWEQYKLECRKRWMKIKRFTPTKTVHQQYLNLPCPEDKTIFGIKSGLGTGKTTLLVNWLKNEWQNHGGVSLGYRNTLLMQFCKKSGFVHIHNINNWVDIQDTTATVAACIESHKRFQPNDFDDKIIILDEVISIIKTLLFSQTVKDRSSAITLFIEAIKRAKLVVALDGNLSDIYCDFLSQCDPDKQLVKIEHTYQGNKPELVLLEGTIKDENLRKRDNSPWLYELLNNPDMVPCVASDSQKLLESLDEIYQEQGLVGLRIDSKTVNSKEVQEFLEAPEQWIKENHPDYILFSPSCESGLDVPITNYFTHFFGLFFGQIDGDAITQMIMRVRDVDLTRYLWVIPYVQIDDPDAIKSPLLENLQYHQKQRLNRDLHLALSGELNQTEIIAEILTYLESAENSPENKISQRIQAMTYYEKINLRDCVYWMLEKQGYDTSQRVAPHLEAQFTLSKKQISLKTTEVKERESKEILESSDKYIGQPYTLLNWNASWEERCALIKAKIIAKIPGINHHELWSENFIYQIRYQHPNLITQLEDRYLLDHLDKCKEKSKRIYHKQLVKGRQGKKLTPWKLTPRYQRLKALHDVGIHDLIHSHYGVELTGDHKIVQAIMAKCRQKKYWQALGKKPHKDTMKYLKWLLKQIGYDLNNRKVKNSQGRVIRVFNVSSIPHHDVASYITPIMEAITCKYEQPSTEINWEEGKESVLQESVCSTENSEENNQKVFSTENGDNQHQLSHIAVDDPSKILIEDPPHRQPAYDTTSSANLDRNTQNMETTTNPNLDMNEVGMERIIESNVDINIEEMETTTEPDISNKEIVSTNSHLDINIWEMESVGEIPLEAIISFEDRQFIAGLISHSETVEDIKFLRDESGLTKEKLQLGWDLLPSEEK
ncbi:MAG: plasmid replication protein, CyRepA1 family, partial [Crocosphaera sp.]